MDNQEIKCENFKECLFYGRFCQICIRNKNAILPDYFKEKEPDYNIKYL